MGKTRIKPSDSQEKDVDLHYLLPASKIALKQRRKLLNRMDSIQINAGLEEYYSRVANDDYEREFIRNSLGDNFHQRFASDTYENLSSLIKPMSVEDVSSQNGQGELSGNFDELVSRSMSVEDESSENGQGELSGNVDESVSRSMSVEDESSENGQRESAASQILQQKLPMIIYIWRESAASQNGQGELPGNRDNSVNIIISDAPTSSESSLNGQGETSMDDLAFRMSRMSLNDVIDFP